MPIELESHPLSSPTQPEEQTLSDTHSFSAADLAPVTGRRQALILVSSFLTICITIGFNQSYGVFQSYYTSPGQKILPSAAEKQSALIAFVGTLGAGLTWGGSIAVNPLMARVKDVRYLTVTGVVLMSLGFGLASLSSQVSVLSCYCMRAAIHLRLIHPPHR